jgi:hypothetical protein
MLCRHLGDWVRACGRSEFSASWPAGDAGRLRGGENSCDPPAPARCRGAGAGGGDRPWQRRADIQRPGEGLWGGAQRRWHRHPGDRYVDAARHAVGQGVGDLARRLGRARASPPIRRNTRYAGRSYQAGHRPRRSRALGPVRRFSYRWPGSTIMTAMVVPPAKHWWRHCPRRNRSSSSTTPKPLIHGI